MLKNYFKIAFRYLISQKTFSIINIAGLSIGLASVVLIFLWINEETSYDNFHTNKDQISRLVIDLENTSQATCCGAIGPAIKEEIPEVIDISRVWGGWPNSLFYNEERIAGKGSFAEQSLLKIFSFPIIDGSLENSLVDNHSIVITQKMADKLFKDESAIGKVVQIKNRSGKKEDFMITAVIEDIPKNSHIQFDFLFSYNLLNEWYKDNWAERWSNFSFMTYILTEKDASLELVSKKITDVFNSHKEKKRVLYAQPLSEVYLNENISNFLGPSGSGLYVKIFSFTALLILLLACINYMNLATARAIKRSKEVGIRKVIGARRREIIFQNITESIFTSLISLPVTILIIELMIPVLSTVVGKELDFNYMQLDVILGLVVLVTLTGLISGIYPALYISSFKPSSILKKDSIGLGSGNSLRRVLVVFQFSLSIIIIVAALVTSSQMKFIQEKSLGFNKENMLYAWVPGRNNEVLKAELYKNPNIFSVGAASAQLDWLAWWAGINEWDGKIHEDYYSFGVLEVGYDFLKTYEIEMALGRYYSEEFSTDKGNSIIVNESAIKLMNLENPIGKTIKYSGKNRTIIGVVKDFHFQSLHEEIGPVLFTLYPKKLPCLGIRVSGFNMPEVISYINDVFKKNIPEETIKLRFLDDTINNLYESEMQRISILNYFSAISIFIALLGLFGLSAYSIERRTKEIGIRKVLGASVPKIISTLSKEYLMWIIIANVIAIPLSYYIVDLWLQDFAYRVDINPILFFLSSSLVLFVALLTVGLQTLKTATSNPVKSLRSE